MIDEEGFRRDARGFRLGGYGPVEHHDCAGRSSRAVLGQHRACPYEGRYPVGGRWLCFFHKKIEQGLITTIDGRHAIGAGELTSAAPAAPDLFQLIREWK